MPSAGRPPLPEPPSGAIGSSNASGRAAWARSGAPATPTSTATSPIKLLAHGSAGGSDTRERFRREALALSRLSHPGVATIFDFDSQDGIDFLVMEYVPGGSLEARIEAGPLALDDLTRVGAAVADALHSAHERGVLHRDLKPANVVLTERRSAEDPRLRHCAPPGRRARMPRSSPRPG